MVFKIISTIIVSIQMLIWMALFGDTVRNEDEKQTACFAAFSTILNIFVLVSLWVI